VISSVEVLPSPKFQFHETTLLLLESVKKTSRGASPVCGVAVNAAFTSEKLIYIESC